MEFFEKTISSKTLFEGKVFDVCQQKVTLNNGSTANRELVIHNGGAAILAIDENENIFLVRQYRKGAEREMLEIPAGKLEKGETPEACAVRELKEEIGAEAKNIEKLAEFYVTPAYCTEKISVYLATGLTITGQKLDDDEFLEIVTMKLDDAFDKVMSGEIIDAKTIIAILKAKTILK